ncbi:MAG: hypothetical protein NT166_10785 [Candidatus Aminicenantes bacterium]|nr:hypothetical protein [Candidatus Aminicenantes bacterium]
MNEILENFLKFLAEEYDYLVKIKLFLLDVPDMITTGKINEPEFRDFMEKYELETARFLFEKNRFKESIAGQLNIPPGQATFKMLVNLGRREFEETGAKVIKITNEISKLLLRISIYLDNFSKLQNKFKRFNNFLYRNDYSAAARGVELSHNYTPGRNFYGEA